MLSFMRKKRNSYDLSSRTQAGEVEERKKDADKKAKRKSAQKRESFKYFSLFDKNKDKHNCEQDSKRDPKYCNGDIKEQENGVSNLDSKGNSDKKTKSIINPPRKESLSHLTDTVYTGEDKQSTSDNTVISQMSQKENFPVDNSQSIKSHQEEPHETEICSSSVSEVDVKTFVNVGSKTEPSQSPCETINDILDTSHSVIVTSDEVEAEGEGRRVSLLDEIIAETTRLSIASNEERDKEQKEIKDENKSELEESLEDTVFDECEKK